MSLGESSDQITAEHIDRYRSDVVVERLNGDLVDFQAEWRQQMAYDEGMVAPTTSAATSSAATSSAATSSQSRTKRSAAPANRAKRQRRQQQHEQPEESAERYMSEPGRIAIVERAVLSDTDFARFCSALDLPRDVTSQLISDRINRCHLALRCWFNLDSFTTVELATAIAEFSTALLAPLDLTILLHSGDGTDVPPIINSNSIVPAAPRSPPLPTRAGTEQPEKLNTLRRRHSR